jgi:formate transporter
MKKKIPNIRKLPIFDFDAYSPEEVAKRVEQIGVKKVRFPAPVTLVLGILGGSFISLGVMYYLFTIANPAGHPGLAQIFAPLFYAMGYILAFLAGAEVFTTNNLAMMSFASGRVTVWELSRNWILVLFANVIGASIVVLMFILSGQVDAYDGALADYVVKASAEKLSLTYTQNFFQGVFGNFLICSGAWISLAGRSVTDKILGLILPLSAVPALGFQHFTGNLFYKILAFILAPDTELIEIGTDITLVNTAANLSVVALGNIVGGGVLIALVYYFVYMRMK